MCSSDEEERRFGVKQIIELRMEKETGDTSPRPRKTPGINISATNLPSMITWENSVYEPLLTCSLSKEELVTFLDTPMVVPNLPCHGQGVERVVKEVTRAAAAVYGESKRDGFVRATTAQRELVPLRSSKQDLVKMTKPL